VKTKRYHSIYKHTYPTPIIQRPHSILKDNRKGALLAISNSQHH